MSLNLVGGSKKNFIHTKSLPICVEMIAQTPEAIEYLQAKCAKAPPENQKSPGFEEFRISLDKLADYAEATQIDNGDGWRGDEDAIYIGRDNYRKLRVKEAGRIIIENNKKLDFHCAISNDTKIQSAYVENGEVLNKNSKKAIAANDIFDCWLEEENLIRKASDNLIYAIDKSGEILRDENGDLIRVEGAKLNELIIDPERGLQAYYQENDLGEHASFVSRVYQEPAVSKEIADVTAQKQQISQAKEHAAIEEKEVEQTEATKNIPGG